MRARLILSLILGIVTVPVLFLGLIDPLEGGIALLTAVALGAGVRLLSAVPLPRLAWIAFVTEARALGFVSAAAVPLRLRAQVVGALNVFWAHTQPIGSVHIDAAQALADVAVVGLVQQRLARESGVLAEQLQSALHARVAIEQAKGIVAVKAGVSIAEAFAILEATALERHDSIVRVSQGVVDRVLTWQDGALRPAVVG